MPEDTDPSNACRARGCSARTAGIMQPTYLPWIGHFDLIDQVDVFVFLDTVQLVRRSWDVRNRIKAPPPKGELFLTVPVRRTGHRDDTRLCDALVDDASGWRERHLRSMRHAYARAPGFAEVFPALERVLLDAPQVLSQLNLSLLRFFLGALGIATPIRLASELPPAAGNKDVLLLELCTLVGCRRYISQPSAAAYIERERAAGAFAGSGVDLAYHRYEHPRYPQVHGAFRSHLSIVDLAMSCGFEQSLEVIRSGRRPCLTPQGMRREIGLKGGG